MAKLKFRVPKLEDIEEPYRGLYAQDGDEYQLSEVEGLPDAAGALAALDDERKKHETARKALKGFYLDGKPIDVAKYQEILGKEAELDKALKLQDGKVNEVVAAQQREFEKERQAWLNERGQLQQENGGLQKRIVRDTVVRSLRDAFAKAKGKPMYIDDVERRADEFGLFDGKVYRLDKDGESPMRHPKESLRYYEPDDFMQEAAKTKADWFESSTGGGANGNDRRPTVAGVISRDDPGAVIGNLKDLAAGKVRAQ